MSESKKKKVTYDNNLIRQTCGKLYTNDDKGELIQSGNWCFQFSGENSEAMDVVVSLAGDSAMAAAMGAPMNSMGELNKDAVLELKNWLTDILQKMNEKKIEEED